MSDKTKRIEYWIANGVEFADTNLVYIDADVTIGAGTFIGTGVHILQGSIIGNNCRIHEFSSIKNSTLENNIEIFSFTIVHDSFIGAHSLIGPFAHVSNESHLGAHTAIGNFVEVKRSTIGTHTKAKHLTYLGDACIGENVNIGAGTITCNYNGIKKQKTIIEDNVFVGSNNTLVAPVTISRNAYTAAGSVITEDVPENALAIARSRQTNKAEYAKKLKQNTLQTVPSKIKQDPNVNETI